MKHNTHWAQLRSGENSNNFTIVCLQMETSDAALLQCSPTLPAPVRLHYILCKSGVAIHLSSSHTLILKMFALESMERPHEDIFVDDAGFSLPKRRSRGGSINGQRGGNVTLCAAIGNQGVLHLHPTLGPYNMQHLLTLLCGLQDVLIDPVQQCSVSFHNPVSRYKRGSI